MTRGPLGVAWSVRSASRCGLVRTRGSTRSHATRRRMRPILLHLGTYAVYSHAVFVAFGVVGALAISWRIAERAGRADQDLLVIIAGGLVGAAILSRYGLVLRYLVEAHDPSVRGFLDYGGKSLLAGLAGAYAGVVITKRLIGYRRPTGDLFIPGTALGMAIGRIGCFLAERPGTVTTLPWGVRVPPDAAPRIANCPACVSGAAMHPSFLYEVRRQCNDGASGPRTGGRFCRRHPDNAVQGGRPSQLRRNRSANERRPPEVARFSGRDRRFRRDDAGVALA